MQFSVLRPGLPSTERHPVRICVRCCAITAEPVVATEGHESSGPGFSAYAC
ncbi:hypothetical protein [Streptomyces hydrogenans]|uniref:hypothetical protein n=1 Tax=Streptomyces hydrogenans TaxID=1873719 RepID=UPI003813EBE5